MTARNETTKSTTTLDYYNKNAKKFISGTISVDFGIVQNRFLDKLHPGAEILDYGCGSGRDTKYFLEQGCKVTAIDGSQELCKLASEYTGIPVKHMLFQELNEKEAYDGIWACSSKVLPEERIDATNLVNRIKCQMRKYQFCIRCSACDSTCPHGAIDTIHGQYTIDENKCQHCKHCIAKFYNGCIMCDVLSSRKGTQ